jgi:hypothetical protein
MTSRRPDVLASGDGPSNTNEPKRATVDFETDLHQALRVRATASHRSISARVNEACAWRSPRTAPRGPHPRPRRRASPSRCREAGWLRRAIPHPPKGLSHPRRDRRPRLLPRDRDGRAAPRGLPPTRRPPPRRRVRRVRSR